MKNSENNASNVLVINSSNSMPKLVCSSNTSLVDLPCKDVAQEPKSRYKPIVPKQSTLTNTINGNITPKSGNIALNCNVLKTNVEDNENWKVQSKKSSAKKSLRISSKSLNGENIFAKNIKPDKALAPVKILPKIEKNPTDSCQVTSTQHRNGQQFDKPAQINILDEAMEVSGILDGKSDGHNAKKVENLRCNQGKYRND